jgi:DNA-binding LacI/PurR family transcriptional regulator
MTLKQHGLQCPGDVSIISFDNTRLAEACSPPLTSVGLDQKTFAAKALELLIHPDQSPLCGSIYLPAFLAERQSTQPLPPRKK